jgi:hypothetical protein
MLWVYALTSPAIGAPRAVGARGEPLRTVAVGSIVAIVGEVREIPPPTEPNLREYAAVVEGLTLRAPSLLPVRYGTCVRDADELVLVLASRQRRLLDQLRLVRHRAQMTVRLPLRVAAPGPAPDRPGAHAVAGRGGTARRTGRPHAGAAYLRARADQSARDRRVPGFDPLRASVRRWVRAERVEKRERVATIYHLVPRGSVEAYRRALERAAAREALRVTITGPWAPYAFGDAW